MPKLLWNCLIAACLAWVIALFVAFLGLTLTILSWLRAPDIPRAAIFPVLLVIFGKSAELATLLGIPIGFALAARRFVQSTRTKMSATQTPLGPHWRALLALCCALGAILGIACLACINYWSLAPGRMARSALTSARERCLAEPGVPGDPIPVLGATWICGKSGLPRLEGPLPGSHHRGWFSAGNVHVSDDLLTVDLEDVRLGVRPSGRTPKLQLRTLHASVHGVRAVFRPAQLGPWSRAVLGVGTGFLLGGLGIHQILINRWTRRKVAWALSGTSALSACVALMLVDIKSGGVLASYLWVPLASVVVFALANGLIHRFTGRLTRKSPAVVA